MSGAMTYKVTIQTGDKAKSATVSDPVSKTLKEAITNQLNTWGNRLIEMRMAGKRVYPPDSSSIEV